MISHLRINNCNLLKKLLRVGVFVLLFCINLAKLNAQVFDEESEKIESLEEKIERTKQLIVMLKVDLEGSSVLGAGILVGREKHELLILTAYHLLHRGVTEAKNVQVKFRTKPGKFFAATLLTHGNEEEMDWALLSVKDLAKYGFDICSVKFNRKGDVSTLNRSDEVFPVGNPNGIEWAMPVMPDKISDLIGNDIVFQSAFISNGNSGGALLDSSGEIVGMVIQDQPPFGRAIKIDTLLSTLAFHSQLHEDYGWTKYSPLHIAANEGNIDRIKYLLTDDCYQVNMQDAAGRTPLHYTAGATSVVLIEDAKYSLEAMKLLVSAGADINALDKYGDAPALYAVSAGRIDLLKFLIQSGADMNKGSHPLLVSALWSSRRSKEIADQELEIIKLLIAKGANVNAKNQDGKTPLSIAYEKNNTPAIELFRSHGAEGTADETQLNAYGYELIKQNKIKEAIKIFKDNVKQHPDSWNAYDSLGEGYALDGNKKEAIANYKIALSKVPDGDPKQKIQEVLKKLEGN